eukprot:CAMPEP_0173216092 /NCGR_PEP_ID=MMETSP1141-20130122/26833_1 /TAXON_ID=483371 /ORGANISM="non described non described, Strain CCMP2298" /LENGTH=71 /DNA_ID=CAMNT_0014143523 /DNA_START=1386 /DNA_END=1601 /DNA_ORIENTATION=-
MVSNSTTSTAPSPLKSTKLKISYIAEISRRVKFIARKSVNQLAGIFFSMLSEQQAPILDLAGGEWLESVSS